MPQRPVRDSAGDLFSRLGHFLTTLLVGLLITAPIPDVTVAQQAKVGEIEFWRTVKDTNDAAELEAYLKTYPQGKFAPLARLRIEKLRKGRGTPEPPRKANVRPLATLKSSENAPKFWRNALDTFGDVLTRVLSDYVDKPDNRKLIEGAINGVVTFIPDLEHDAITATARSGLESLRDGQDDIYRGLDALGDFIDAVRIKIGNDSRIIEAAVRGMLGSLDRRSRYIKPPQQWYTGPQAGIGIQIASNGDAIKIVAPLDDCPAAKAGLQAGDRITHIGGLEIALLTLRQAVLKLRGLDNTLVSLTVVRSGTERPFEVKVVRDMLCRGGVSTRIEGDVGYIKLWNFNEQTHDQLVKSVDDLKANIGSRLRGYIIDLRDAWGGSLDDLIRVSDAFWDHGAILLTRSRWNVHQAHARLGDIAEGMAIVVLTGQRTGDPVAPYLVVDDVKYPGGPVASAET